MERAGHRVEIYSFGEALAAATPSPCARHRWARHPYGRSPVRAARPLGWPRRGRRHLDLRWHRHGRIARGPLDGETRRTLEALGAPVHTVLVGERELRDLSVAAVLTDDFAFVRTPIKLEAVLRHKGYSDRQVEVTWRARAACSMPRPCFCAANRGRRGSASTTRRWNRATSFSRSDSRAGGRSAGKQQQPAVHHEGHSRPRARPARVWPAVVG